MPKKTIFILLLVIFSMSLLLLGFFLFKDKRPGSKDVSKPRILVSILPQKQIVEKIAGNDFEVSAIIPPGFSPETYDPTSQDMQIISSADIYFRIGHIPFELINIPKIQEVNPSMKIIDTSVNNELIMLEEHNHDGTDQEEIENHEAEIDPHVWLAPTMVKQQAEIIKNSLVELYPDQATNFEENFVNLTAELDDLNNILREAFAPIQGKTMLVYHPGFGYLAHIYGFNQEHFQIEGKDPSISQLQAIIEKAKAEDIKVIFVQKQFSTSSAQAIAENIGGSVVQIDPLDPNYIGNIKNIAQIVSENLKK